jgi:hypothetical protein
MNISALINIARRDFLNDVEDPQTWRNDFFLRSFSEAQRQACSRVDFVFTDSLGIRLRSGVSSYLLPTNLKRLLAITLDGVEIEKSFVEQLPRDWRTGSGFSSANKQRYVIRGNRITFSPTPDATDDGSNVFIEGYTIPTENFISLSDEPVIPVQYHKALIHWVVYEAYSGEVANAEYMDKKDTDRSQTHLALFNQVLGNPIDAQVQQFNFTDVSA